MWVHSLVKDYYSDGLYLPVTKLNDMPEDKQPTYMKASNITKFIQSQTI